MLAGLFSSAVTQRSSSVLLRPSVCGQWANLAEVTANHWDTKAVIEGVHFASMMRQGLITSSRLFRTCNESSSLQENCFALGNWPLWPSPTNVACPFGSELCAIDNAVIVDSGYLNSRSHLGINSPRGDSVNFRRTATCAPLRTAGLTSNVALRDDQGDVQVLDESFVGYNFGRNILLGMWILSHIYLLLLTPTSPDCPDGSVARITALTFCELMVHAVPMNVL